jgi:hypothetical protein
MTTMSQIMGCASETNTRLPLDAYDTPTSVIEALIRVEGSNWGSGPIWDPCSGNGNILRALHGRESRGDDINRGADFLNTTEAYARIIVTNPPYRYASEFIRHAHNLGIEYHAWLLKADFLNAQRAIKLIDAIGYPARIWALTERPDFLGQGAPTMNCSWYVFDGRSDAASLKLLSVIA